MGSEYESSTQCKCDVHVGVDVGRGSVIGPKAPQDVRRGASEAYCTKEVWCGKHYRWRPVAYTTVSSDFKVGKPVDFRELILFFLINKFIISRHQKVAYMLIQANCRGENELRNKVVWAKS